MQVRHMAAGLGAQFVDGSCGGDVQGPIVGISPIQVCRLFWHFDGSDVMSLRVPHPNSFRTSDVKVAGFVYAHAIGYTFVLIASLFAKYAAIDERAIAVDVVNANVALLAIVHVKAFTFGRKSEPVGLR